MNKTKTIIITAFAAVAVAIGVTTVVLVNQPAGAPADNQQNTSTQQTQAETQAENNEYLVSFTAEADKSVLDQLKTHAEVVTKDSSFGVYVDSINGVVGGTDGKYWAYYVDGEMAQVGASEYVTKGGEVVEWKFE